MSRTPTASLVRFSIFADSDLVLMSGRIMPSASPALNPGSGGVVEDDPERMARATHDATDSVAHCHAIGAAGALHRAMVDGKDHRLAQLERHHRRSRLRARPLLDQHELAAGEIF